MQCVQLLRNLVDSSGERLSILISIHQPSARILSQFDDIYVLSKDGRCLYNGPPANLVTFLTDYNLVCPRFHNPSDFIIEIASGELGPEALDRIYTRQPAANAPGDSFITNFANSTEEVVVKRKGDMKRSLSHFTTLLWRNGAVVTREPLLMSMRFLSHVSVGIVVSLMYGSSVGEAPGCRSFNGYGSLIPLDERFITRTNENATLILFTLMFLSFSAMMVSDTN